MFPGYPKPAESSEIAQARRILQWLDQSASHFLPKDSLEAYHRARCSLGSRSTTTRAHYWPGGPAIHAPRMEADGTGDEAYGPSRVRAIVSEVIVPAIEAGQLSVQVTAELLQRLRGEFADSFRIVERAHAKRISSEKKGSEPDEEKCE